jgi:two-component system, chemotaxis family, CheB/CheR fusion protein
MRSTSIKRKKKLHKQQAPHNAFPVVAIGASAGGLEAMSILLKNLPANTGMAYIFVQHLSPNYKSLLTSILARTTNMKVQAIDDMELMKPDNVYVIPHNKGIEVTDGHIRLLPRSKGTPAISIDVLFSSLAQTHKENVVGIILSGNASDGTKGIQAIKKAGGITFAQDDSAQVSSMPDSAIASGAVDFILSPENIARELIRLSTDMNSGKSGKLLGTESGLRNNPELNSILKHLHKKSGVDFSHYKMSTLTRRLSHRMLQHEINSIKVYARPLQKDKKESDLLYKDLLIHVTGFFRDVENFNYLKSTLLPKLLKSKALNETLRIWTIACSSGEEAYSIAMLISELQRGKKKKVPVKIVATDLSEGMIQEARIGKYAAADMKGISKQRISQFFTKTGDEYLISKELREMCVFAPHNILNDPPFFRMDFISCRNLLIYFDATAQKKTLGILHFALNEGKYLMLGKAESVGSVSHLFGQLSSKFRVYYSKKNVGIPKITPLEPRFPKINPDKKTTKLVPRKSATAFSSELDGAINSTLLLRHMPACAVINKDMEILQFKGSTSLYLSHPSGKASLNILKMMRPEFAFELRSAVHSVLKTKKAFIKSGMEMVIQDTVRNISLEVSLLNVDWEEPLLLVVFILENSTEPDPQKQSNSTLTNNRIKKLTQELTTVRSRMHSLIESQEKVNEELQTANEEIVSANEEFQTLNEELETTKEEIEATNEELLAANQELKTHNELLSEASEYAQTIIATIHEPMLVLDETLNVKSANKSFYKKFLVTQDETENKPLFKLGNSQWNIPRLRKLLNTLISKNTSFENFEVTHTFPELGEKIMLLNASRIIQKTHREKLILLAIEDITERTHYHRKENALLKNDIIIHEEIQRKLENAVKSRTKQLHDKNSELENANKDLTSFTYVSSHDLQEPLRKIQNFVGLMLDEERESLTDKGKEYLTKTFDTAVRMRSLIDDLLNYSRMKNSDRKLEEVNFTDIIKEVSAELEDSMHEKIATIKTTNLGSVNVVRFQFYQLIQNLVSNSLKFSKPGISSHITIKNRIARGSSLTKLKLSALKDYNHITYTDNGIGFDAQYSERIFEVFQRLHSQQKYKGTGIGLAICKRIVENHHGIISASGKVNKGATFDIYLPINS